MCEHCSKAKVVLEAVIPYPNDHEKLKKWAVESQNTIITRMVTAYLILCESDYDEIIGNHLDGLSHEEQE
jgi:hypothetical protein